MRTIVEYMSSKMVDYTVKATDDNILMLVNECLDKYGHNANLNYIDVSKVTNMRALFSCLDDLGEECKDLNPDVSKWDVPQVTTMYAMFCGCESFNQDLSKWDVSSLKDGEQLFSGCTKFNQDLSNWKPASTSYWASAFKGTPIEKHRFPWLKSWCE